MSGLLLLGLSVGLVGAVAPMWAFHLSMDMVNAGRAYLGLALGIGAGLAAASLTKSTVDAPQSVFRAGAWISAAALAGSAFLTSPVQPPFVLAVLGLGLGAVIRASANSIETALTFRRAPSLMHLAGVSFGFGAVGACLAAWTLGAWYGWQAVTTIHAVAFVLLGWLSGRPFAGEQFGSDEPQESIDWRSALTPTGFLLGVGLLLQAACFGALGGWLGLYVFRKLGVTIDTSLAILGLFWVAVTAGRVGAARLPTSHRMSLSAGVALVTVLGALFLLKTVETSGALVGAVLLGAGAGATQPLTIGAVTRRYALEHAGLVRLFAAGSLLTGFGSAWLVGPLSTAWGVSAVLWSAIFCTLASWGALTLIVVETRLSQSPAGAR